MTRYDDLPKFTRSASYAVDVPFAYLEAHIERHIADYALDLDPDFQRAHVWTEAQQIAFVEYVFKGGTSGLAIYTNCVGWHGGDFGAYVLVDGKQRLNAGLRFLRNEIPIFGLLRREIGGPLRMHIGFKWHVNDLATRAEVLQWYLDMNVGGTIHTDDEIQKVHDLLAKEPRNAL